MTLKFELKQLKYIYGKNCVILVLLSNFQYSDYKLNC